MTMHWVYKIAAGDCITALENSINDIAAKGFSAVGPMIISRGKSAPIGVDWRFYQMMQGDTAKDTP